MSLEAKLYVTFQRQFLAFWNPLDPYNWNPFCLINLSDFLEFIDTLINGDGCCLWKRLSVFQMSKHVLLFRRSDGKVLLIMIDGNLTSHFFKFKTSPEDLNDYLKIIIDVTENKDEFGQIFESWWSKVLFGLSFLSIEIFGNAFAVFLILFDKFGEDSLKRSITNRLTSQAAFPLIMDNLFAGN